MVSEPRPLDEKPGLLSSKPGFFLPAVEAIIIQAVSLALLYALLLFADTVFNWQMTIGAAVLLQGVTAAALTYCRRLSLWWLLIQLLFPIALLAAYSLALSPVIYLALFLLLLLVYWTPFKTRVPLYLSGKNVWEKVASVLPEDEPIRFIDIGSGLGGLALYLAERFPKSSITGIELAPFPWLLSWLRSRFSRSSTRFILGNYDNLDFSQFDIVFAFLSPAAMNSLWKKASSEMREGALLLSYEFIIPNVKPDILIHANLGGADLYGWRISKVSQK